MVELAKVLTVDGEVVRFVIERTTGASQPLTGRLLVPPGAAGAVGDTSVSTSTEDAHSHTVTVRPLQAGDVIAVASVGRTLDQWIVLGRYV